MMVIKFDDCSLILFEIVELVMICFFFVWVEFSVGEFYGVFFCGVWFGFFLNFIGFLLIF